MVEYCCEFDDFSKLEKDLAELFLKKSNIIRLDMKKWTQLSIPPKAKGDQKDPEFRKILAKWKKAFIKKETVREKVTFPLLRYQLFGINKSATKTAVITHYYFKITPEMKKTLIKDLTWDAYSSDDFYGFEDPTFFKNDKEIGNIISHEPMCWIKVTKTEKEALDKKLMKPKTQ